VVPTPTPTPTPNPLPSSAPTSAPAPTRPRPGAVAARGGWLARLAAHASGGAHAARQLPLCAAPREWLPRTARLCRLGRRGARLGASERELRARPLSRGRRVDRMAQRVPGRRVRGTRRLALAPRAPSLARLPSRTLPSHVLPRPPPPATHAARGRKAHVLSAAAVYLWRAPRAARRCSLRLTSCRRQATS
jgi:hypothetical protein